MKSLADLFEDTLKDIYFAEKQIVKALPKMAKKASSEDLSDAFNTHLEETIVHVERLEQVFKLIDKAPRGKKCEAILGIIKEAEELMQEAESDTVRDAAMVGAAQAVEHYEISRYGTLKASGQQTGQGRRRRTARRDIAGREGHRREAKRTRGIGNQCRGRRPADRTRRRDEIEASGSEPLVRAPEFRKTNVFVPPRSARRKPWW